MEGRTVYLSLLWDWACLSVTCSRRCVQVACKCDLCKHSFSMPSFTAASLDIPQKSPVHCSEKAYFTDYGRVRVWEGDTIGTWLQQKMFSLSFCSDSQRVELLLHR